MYCDYSQEPITIGEPIVVEQNYLGERIFVKQKYYEKWLAR